MSPSSVDRSARRAGGAGSPWRRAWAGLAGALLAGLAGAAHAAPAVLFDGLLGTEPGQQGWVWLTDPFIGAQATRAAGTDAVTLDSTPVLGESAGWFANLPPFPRHPLLPGLDRITGYRVEWDVQVLAESHVSPDRAGFSVIVLGDDLRGVELAFWSGEVWAQADSPLFTHAEGALLDTTAARTRYALTIRGDRYELRAGGLPLLEGPLRDYSSFGAPYDIPDFVFVGDDTSRGAARAELARVEACAGDAAASPGESLRVTRQGSGLRLEVADTGAAEYRAYRGASPQAAGATLHGTDAAPVLLDAASIPDGGAWYFLVRAVDGCGFEQD